MSNKDIIDGIVGELGGLTVTGPWVEPSSGAGVLAFDPVVNLTSDTDNMTRPTAAIKALTCSSDRDITGMTAAPQGTVAYIANVNPDGGKKLKLKSQDNGSTAANRFALDGDLDVEPGSIVYFVYNTALNRWMHVL